MLSSVSVHPMNSSKLNLFIKLSMDECDVDAQLLLRVKISQANLSDALVLITQIMVKVFFQKD